MTGLPRFVLVHGAGDAGWYWHLVEAELRERGFETAAPDLPDGETSLAACADRVVAAGAGADEVVVVGQSFGAFAATLAAARLPTEMLVYVAGMVPRPGESPADWWSAVDYAGAVREQAARDGGLTGHEDPYVSFFHDVPRGLAEEAMARERTGTLTDEDRPLDAWPPLHTEFVLCAEDRFFPAALMRRVVADRLGIVPDEITSGHCVALSRPAELASLLSGYVERDLG
jgi:pimeloyl-ACP methyl ester carboxylesterase